MNARAAALVILAALASGCTAIRDPGEQAWLALHAVDTAQTFRIADAPECFREDRAAWLIGEHPSKGAVAAWSIGSAGLHLAVTEFLLDRDWKIATRVWQAVTLIEKGSAIHQNYSIGIRVGAANKPRHACGVSS